MMLLPRLLLLGGCGLLVTEVRGQATALNPEMCTYSFVVPQTDLVTTCQRFSSQQITALENKIDDLEAKIRGLSSGQDLARGMNKLNVSVNPRFSCSCQNDTSFSFAYTDCQDVKSILNGRSGVYEITPIQQTGQLIAVDGDKSEQKHRYWVTTTGDPFKVYCDLDGEIGWTVIMRRRQMDVSFNRTWREYKEGFGNIDEDGDFWLGLDRVHRITKQKYASFSLWILATTEMDVPHVSAYSVFEVAGEQLGYMLTVGGFHGHVGADVLSDANGRFFTARDRDGNTTEWRSATPVKPVSSSYRSSRYYRSPSQCMTDSGETSGGGWWYYDHTSKYVSSYSSDKTCGDINLNAGVPYMKGLNSLKMVEMKIRPSD